MAAYHESANGKPAGDRWTLFSGLDLLDDVEV
jgi:hypothetical protein